MRSIIKKRKAEQIILKQVAGLKARKQHLLAEQLVAQEMFIVQTRMIEASIHLM